MNAEIHSIEATIAQYFDGLYEGDTEKLARVFSSKASLFMESAGQLTALPVLQWFDRIASRPSPGPRRAKRDDCILLIDFVGPVNALAKIRCLVDPAEYIDYLTMIKFEGRWQIVAKAYRQVAG